MNMGVLFVRDQGGRDIQLERDHDAAEGGHMYIERYWDEVLRWMINLGFQMI